jgi:hypothetical protein
MRPQLRNISILLVAFVGAGLLAASARAAAPSNTSPPTITGTLEQGRTLTVRTGTWTNSPSTFFYRWQRCSADGTGCGNIDKATQRTYTLRANDVDQTVRVVVTASNGDGQTSANSAATDVISSNAAPEEHGQPGRVGEAAGGRGAHRGPWHVDGRCAQVRLPVAALRPDRRGLHGCCRRQRQHVRRARDRRRPHAPRRRDGDEPGGLRDRRVRGDCRRPRDVAALDSGAGRQPSPEDRDHLRAVRRREGVGPVPGVRRLAPEPEHPRA